MRKSRLLRLCNGLFVVNMALVHQTSQISRWYRQFSETGCLCNVTSPGHPRVSQEDVARVRTAFARSPRKFTRRASRGLGFPQPTVWKVSRKRLVMKPYRLQIVQAITPNDKVQSSEFCDFILTRVETDDAFTETDL